MSFDYSTTTIYKKLYKEVVNVFGNMSDDKLPVRLTEEDLQNITQRICEERPEDAIDFYLPLSAVEETGDNEDWSDINNGIENMIIKYIQELN